MTKREKLDRDERLTKAGIKIVDLHVFLGAQNFLAGAIDHVMGTHAINHRDCVQALGIIGTALRQQAAEYYDLRVPDPEKPKGTFTVYNDPLTRKSPEGEAQVLKVLDSSFPHQSQCLVKFLDDGFQTTRWVDHLQLNEAGFDVPAPEGD